MVVDGYHVPFGDLEDQYEQSTSRRASEHRSLLGSRLKVMEPHDEDIDRAVERIAYRLKDELRTQRSGTRFHDSPHISPSPTPMPKPHARRADPWDYPPQYTASPQSIIETLLKKNDALSDIVSKIASSPRPHEPLDSVSVISGAASVSPSRSSKFVDEPADRYKDALRDCEQKRRKRGQKIAHLQTTILTKDKLIERLVEEGHRHASLIESLKQQVSECESLKQQHSEIIGNKEKEITANHERITQLTDSLTTQKSIVEQLSSRNDELNRKLHAASDAHTDFVTNFEEKHTSLIAEVETNVMKRAHDESMKMEHYYKSVIDDLEARHGELVLASQKSSEFANDTLIKLNKAREEVASLELEKKEAKPSKDLTMLSELAEKFSCHLAELPNFIEHLSEDNKSLRKVLKQYREDLHDIRQEQVKHISKNIKYGRSSLDETNELLRSVTDGDLESSNIWDLESSSEAHK